MNLIFNDWIMFTWIAVSLLLSALAFWRWHNWLGLLLCVPYAVFAIFYFRLALDPFLPEATALATDLNIFRPGLVSLLSVLDIYLHRDLAARLVGEIHCRLVGLLALWG